MPDNEPCSCFGCWDCTGLVPGCRCDAVWDIAELFETDDEGSEDGSR